MAKRVDKFESKFAEFIGFDLTTCRITDIEVVMCDVTDVRVFNYVRKLSILLLIKCTFVFFFSFFSFLLAAYRVVLHTLHVFVCYLSLVVFTTYFSV